MYYQISIATPKPEEDYQIELLPEDYQQNLTFKLIVSGDSL